MKAISAAEATAEVFYTAFEALSRKEKHAFFTKLLQHREFYEDLIDTTIMEQRRNEPSRSLDDYFAERASRQ